MPYFSLYKYLYFIPGQYELVHQNMNISDNHNSVGRDFFTFFLKKGEYPKVYTAIILLLACFFFFSFLSFPLLLPLLFILLLLATIHSFLKTNNDSTCQQNSLDLTIYIHGIFNVMDQAATETFSFPLSG